MKIPIFNQKRPDSADKDHRAEAKPVRDTEFHPDTGLPPDTERFEPFERPAPGGLEQQSFIPSRSSIASRRMSASQAAAPGGAPKALLELRRLILDRIYMIGAVMGVIALLANLPRIIQTAQWGLLLVYGGAVAILIVFTFERRMSYNLRSALVLGIMYLAAIASLAVDGLQGSGRILLVGMAFIATLLGGLRVRIIGVVLTLGALLVMGILVISGVITPPVPLIDSTTNITPWLIAFAGFAMMTVTGVFSYGIMIDGLEKSLIEQSHLTEALRSERTTLEGRVEQRTESLERRLIQIRTAAEITRSISRLLDMETLLPQVCELVRQRFDLYYVGIFLIEEGQHSQIKYAVLAAGTGEAGQNMLAAGHRLPVGGDSMIGWATSNRQARIALDVGDEATRFNNPHLPNTHSELALPIISGVSSPLETEIHPVSQEQIRGGKNEDAGRVLGAMTVQSEVQAAFDQDDITVLQGIADSLAAAIENARLFAATQKTLEEVRSLHRQYLQDAWASTRRAHHNLSYDTTFDLPVQDNLSDPPDAEPPEPLRLEMPIRLRDETIGNVILEAGDETTATGWRASQIALVEAVTTQAALALENARLLEETRRRATSERAATHLTSRLWSSTDIDSILRTALLELRSTLNASEGWIELWPDAGQDSPTPPALEHANTESSVEDKEAGHVEL